MTEYYTNYHPVLNDNYLINGNFDIWQRGTSQTTAGYLSDDRWWNGHVGSSTKVHSRMAFTLGQTDVPNNPTYFSRTVATTGGTAGDRVVIYQRMESVNTLAGKTATVSFWAKADSTRDISVTLLQCFGSGGSPSSDSSFLVGKYSISTTWQKITGSVAIPQISTKTLGTNGDDALVLTIWFDAGSDFNAMTGSLGNQSGTFDVAQVKVEEGRIATPFIPRTFKEEVELCQRYYCKSYNITTLPGTGATDAGILRCEGQTEYEPINLKGIFKVTMRTIPTITVYSSLGTSGNVTDLNTGGDIPASGVRYVNTNLWSSVILTSPLTPDATTITVRGGCHWAADAEIYAP